MRKVVVNSTPIIALCKTGHLELLKAMYGEINIPEAVYREVSAKNDEIKNQLDAASWVHIRTVTNTEDRRMYRAKLHSGEVEVMMLAQELEADVVLLDDNAARKTAEYLGLPVTGTLGVLIKAKQIGTLECIMPVIHSMLANGIYLSDALVETVRKIAGE